MCRYFCGLSATPKQQKTLIEEFFNACFTKMKASAREGKHSVTFSECQEIAKRVLAANKVDEWRWMKLRWKGCNHSLIELNLQ